MIKIICLIVSLRIVHIEKVNNTILSNKITSINIINIFKLFEGLTSKNKNF